jgi:hypothetical protein
MVDYATRSHGYFFEIWKVFEDLAPRRLSGTQQPVPVPMREWLDHCLIVVATVSFAVKVQL